MEGGPRPYRYYDKFPAKLAALFQKLGGEIKLGAPSMQIVVENGKVGSIRIGGDDRLKKHPGRHRR